MRDYVNSAQFNEALDSIPFFHLGDEGWSMGVDVAKGPAALSPDAAGATFSGSVVAAATISG